MTPLLLIHFPVLRRTRVDGGGTSGINILDFSLGMMGTNHRYANQVSLDEERAHLQNIRLVSPTMLSSGQKNAVDAQTRILEGVNVHIPGTSRKLHVKPADSLPTLSTLPTTTSPIFA